MPKRKPPHRALPGNAQTIFASRDIREGRRLAGVTGRAVISSKEDGFLELRFLLP